MSGPAHTRGAIGSHKVPCLRAIAPDLRRARLLAARAYPIRAISRYAILNGHWDGGSIVGQHRRPSDA